MTNQWAMVNLIYTLSFVTNVVSEAHDESVYSNSMEFLPERFLNDDGKTDISRNPLTISFGFGRFQTSLLTFKVVSYWNCISLRRICPGKFLAENSVWLHVATMLACFTIRPPIGEDGKEFLPPRIYSSGLSSQPLSFPCRITPRGDFVASVVRNAAAELQ